MARVLRSPANGTPRGYPAVRTVANGNVHIPARKIASMADIIVKTAVRDAVDDLNVGADFYDELDTEVQALLDDAERRAHANDRKTVSARDL
jgi:hypothetical protein